PRKGQQGRRGRPNGRRPAGPGGCPGAAAFRPPAAWGGRPRFRRGGRRGTGPRERKGGGSAGAKPPDLVKLDDGRAQSVQGSSIRQHRLIYTDSRTMKRLLIIAIVYALLADMAASAPQSAASVATSFDVKPGSITCDDVPYPYPSSYLPLTLYGQDVRLAYMDVPASGTPNGHTVVLLHGNNFAGFYFGGPIDALRKEGFRVVVPDQIGYGR